MKMDINTYYLKLMSILINFYYQQKVIEKDILTQILFLRKKDKKHQKKRGWKFIRINTSNAKDGYDLDYEVGNIEAFIYEFEDRQLEKEISEKKPNKKIKELEDKIKEKEEESNKKIKKIEAEIKKLEDKNKNSTTNQITNNFGKIIKN